MEGPVVKCRGSSSGDAARDLSSLYYYYYCILITILYSLTTLHHQPSSDFKAAHHGEKGGFLLTFFPGVCLVVEPNGPPTTYSCPKGRHSLLGSPPLRALGLLLSVRCCRRSVRTNGGVNVDHASVTALSVACRHTLSLKGAATSCTLDAALPSSTGEGAVLLRSALGCKPHSQWLKR